MLTFAKQTHPIDAVLWGATKKKGLPTETELLAVMGCSDLLPACLFVTLSAAKGLPSPFLSLYTLQGLADITFVYGSFRFCADWQRTNFDLKQRSLTS
jgi:hypothetical protein